MHNANGFLTRVVRDKQLWRFGYRRSFCSLKVTPDDLDNQVFELCLRFCFISLRESGNDIVSVIGSIRFSLKEAAVPVLRFSIGHLLLTRSPLTWYIWLWCCGQSSSFWDLIFFLCVCCCSIRELGCISFIRIGKRILISGSWWWRWFVIHGIVVDSSSFCVWYVTKAPNASSWTVEGEWKGVLCRWRYCVYLPFKKERYMNNSNIHSHVLIYGKNLGRIEKWGFLFMNIRCHVKGCVIKSTTD